MPQELFKKIIAGAVFGIGFLAAVGACSFNNYLAPHLP